MCGRTVARGFMSSHGISPWAPSWAAAEIFQSPRLEKPLYPTYCTHAGRGSLERNTSQPPRTPSTYRTHTPLTRLYNSPRRPHTLSHRRTLKSGRAHKSAPHLRPPPIHPSRWLLPHYRLSSSLHTHTHTHTRKIAHRPPKRMRVSSSRTALRLARRLLELARHVLTPACARARHRLRLGGGRRRRCGRRTATRTRDGGSAAAAAVVERRDDARDGGSGWPLPSSSGAATHGGPGLTRGWWRPPPTRAPAPMLSTRPRALLRRHACVPSHGRSPGVPPARAPGGGSCPAAMARPPCEPARAAAAAGATRGGAAPGARACSRGR